MKCNKEHSSRKEMGRELWGHDLALHTYPYTTKSSTAKKKQSNHKSVCDLSSNHVDCPSSSSHSLILLLLPESLCRFVGLFIFPHFTISFLRANARYLNEIPNRPAITHKWQSREERRKKWREMLWELQRTRSSRNNGDLLSSAWHYTLLSEYYIAPCQSSNSSDRQQLARILKFILSAWFSLWSYKQREFVFTVWRWLLVDIAWWNCATIDSRPTRCDWFGREYMWSRARSACEGGLGQRSTETRSADKTWKSFLEKL